MPTSAARSARRVAVRWLGGVLARSRASIAARGRRAAAGDAGLDRGAAGRPGDEQRQRLQRRRVAVGLQRVEAVAGEQDALDDGLRRGGGVARRPRAGSSPARRASARRGRTAAAASRSSASDELAAAGADGDDVGAVPARDDERLADLALEAEARRASPGRRRAGAGTAPFSPTGTPIAPAAGRRRCGRRRRRGRRPGATTAPDRTS